MINGFSFLRAAYNENISKYKEETLRCFNQSEIYLRIKIQNQDYDDDEEEDDDYNSKNLLGIHS